MVACLEVAKAQKGFCMILWHQHMACCAFFLSYLQLYNTGPIRGTLGGSATRYIVDYPIYSSYLVQFRTVLVCVVLSNYNVSATIFEILSRLGNTFV